MIENPMIRDNSPKFPYAEYMAMELRKMRRRPSKPAAKPAIPPPPAAEGSKLDVRG